MNVPELIVTGKQDSADSISFSIRALNGNSVVVSGNDTLSAAGVASGYQVYTGGWNFGGSISTLQIEIAGRDVALSVGPIWDSAQVSVVYNVISQVITNSITTVEQWVSLNIGGDTELELVEDLIGNNDFEETDGGFIEITPINEDTEDYSVMDRDWETARQLK